MAFSFPVGLAAYSWISSALLDSAASIHDQANKSLRREPRRGESGDRARLLALGPDPETKIFPRSSDLRRLNAPLLSSELARRHRTEGKAQIAVEERLAEAKRTEAADRVESLLGLVRHSARFTRLMVVGLIIVAVKISFLLNPGVFILLIAGLIIGAVVVAAIKEQKRPGRDEILRY